MHLAHKEQRGKLSRQLTHAVLQDDQKLFLFELVLRRTPRLRLVTPVAIVPSKEFVHAGLVWQILGEVFYWLLADLAPHAIDDLVLEDPGKPGARRRFSGI